MTASRPDAITAATVAFLAAGLGARRTHGNATLTVEHDEFVMRSPNAVHRLARQHTSLDRLNSHWVGFVGSSS